MAAIDREDIRGASFESEGSYTMACCECITDNEFDQLKQNELILEDDVVGSEKVYFCDRCKKQL